MKVVDFAKVAKLNLMKIGGFLGQYLYHYQTGHWPWGSITLGNLYTKPNYSYSVVCRIKQVVCLKTPEFDVILLT